MAARVDIERRAGGYTDRARAYKVLVDGSEVGRIKAGESYGADVAPGHHEVQIAIDWARSPVVELDLAEGESARLFCKPNANPLTVLWYTIFARKRYVALERTG
jgi:hypothetical protein